MIFWKKQKQIQQAVEEYLSDAERCVDDFASAMAVFFTEGLSDQFESLVDRTCSQESTADEKRRDIEATMYGKALIPESRGDILGMLESIDLVPNKAESVLHQIWLQNMSIPPELVEDVKALIVPNCEAFKLLVEAARMVFEDIAAVTPIIDQVTAKEGESDVIERRLIKSLFDSPGDKADKILMKELILEIGAISDRAENAADRLRIIAIKQQA